MWLHLIAALRGARRTNGWLLMVVCHCLRINDRVIARFTADPSITTDDITRECGAGGRCGGCRLTIDAILDQARADRAHAQSTVDTPVARPRRRRLVSAA